MIGMVIKKLRSMKNSLLTSIRIQGKGSDYKRWVNEENLSPGWDSRTEKIAQLVDAGSSVIEFGAGRLTLKACLPAGCTYTPTDLVDRGSGTIICDLNSDTLPQLRQFDIAVFSGVLEYIHDVPRLISHLADYVHTIIASYAVTDRKRKSRRARRANGWVNDYSSTELIEVFEKAGFECNHIEEWKSQLIYRFTKQHDI